MILGPSPGEVKHRRTAHARSRAQPLRTATTLGDTLRTTRARRLLVAAVALLTASAALPAAAADRPARQDRPSHGSLAAVIRCTEYGIPHILAGDYADLCFGTGWAQAADQVRTLADGFATVRGDRSRFFGATAATDLSLSSAGDNLSNDLPGRTAVRHGGGAAHRTGAAGPEPAGEGPDAGIRRRVQHLAGAAPDHRPGLRGRRLGAAGHHAGRGHPLLRTLRAGRPGRRRGRDHRRGAAHRRGARTGSGTPRP